MHQALILPLQQHPMPRKPLLLRHSFQECHLSQSLLLSLNPRRLLLSLVLLRLWQQKWKLRLRLLKQQILRLLSRLLQQQVQVFQQKLLLLLFQCQRLSQVQ
jgi:hypothetical protein